MAESKQVRKPKQARSITLKEKIVDTALKLFCENGFYKTTTNEIAKTAGVSIGSLYAYFKDKDTILLEILTRYHQQFLALHHELLTPINTSKMDRKEFFRTVIVGLINIHEASKQLNRELQVLYFSNPDVAAIMNKQRQETMQIIMEYFHQCKDEIHVEDVDAAAIVTYDFISSIVDRIVFEQNTIDKERILQTGIEALYKFLIA